MLELGHGYWSGFPSPLPSDIFSLLPVASVSKGLVSAPQSMQIQTFLVPSGRWLLCAQPMLRIVLSATPTRRPILFLTAISFGLHPSVQHSSCATET